MPWSSHEDWECLDPDPDPVRDLGYGDDEWTVHISNGVDTQHHVFVSETDADVDRAAYIIVAEEHLVDALDMR